MMSELGHDEEDLDEAMASMDGDGNGNIDVEEFMGWWRGYQSNAIIEETREVDPLEEYYQKMFAKCDEDGNGEIDQEELQYLLASLGMVLDDMTLSLAMAVMDEDQNGVIEWEEFKHWFKDVVTTEIDVSDFCETVGLEGGGEEGKLTFSKAREAIQFLCERDGVTMIADDTLLQGAFPDGTEPDSDTTIPFDVLSKWWLAYQKNPAAFVPTQPTRGLGKSLVDDDDGDAPPKARGKLAKESESGWGEIDMGGGAGEIWTENGWQPVGACGLDSDSDDEGSKKKKKNKKKKVDPKVYEPKEKKKPLDEKLMEAAEAAEERQRNRVKKRSDQMVKQRELRNKHDSGRFGEATEATEAPERNSLPRGPSRYREGLAGRLAPLAMDPNEFNDFIVKAQPRPRTTESSGIHSSGFRRLMTAPYLPTATQIDMAGARRRHHISHIEDSFRYGSRSAPELARPSSAAWQERDITIVSRGKNYVVKMPSVLGPARAQKHVIVDDGPPDDEFSDSLDEFASSDEDLQAEQAEQAAIDQLLRDKSDHYQDYRQGEEHAQVQAEMRERTMEQDYDREYDDKLVAKLHKKQEAQQGGSQQSMMQYRGGKTNSRKEHTAAEEEFYDTANWQFRGPSPRSDESPRSRGPVARSPNGESGDSLASGSPRFSQTQQSPRRSFDGAPAEQPDLSIAGEPSPRYFSPRGSTPDSLRRPIRIVMTVAGQQGPTFASPRSKEATKAMLLDQAEVVGILTRMNRERNTMRVPTASSISADMDSRNVPPGAVAKKAPAANRDRYKGPTEKVDRSLLKWFAEHGSAKNSLRTMVKGKSERKGFQHDWRSPSRDWKLGGEPRRGSQAQAGRQRKPAAGGVLGSYGGWSSGGDEASKPGGMAEQDCLWNRVAQKGQQRATTAPGGARPFTPSRSSAVLW